MARAAATEVTDRWKGFTRTLGLQYLNGDFEIADEQHATSLLYAEGLLTRKKANDLYFPLERLLAALRPARSPPESLLSDTSFVAGARRRRSGCSQVGEDGRVILRAALGAMVVDDFDALPPELRFFAGGDRSIRGFDYQEIGDVERRGRRDRRRVPGRRQRRVRALLPDELGRRGRSSTPAMRSRSSSTRTSAPASACAGSRRSGWCGWTSRGRSSRNSVTPGASIS